ncbi:hypothetical protein [Chromobacterium haemolyticum]|uniref:Lipoprotein n=1 Tax=Chromobacterium haemolyticum TaxID=394935 RepID=A0A1W0CD23_9NEIS|nr:hypothetical protein [Chromobacterium haemolyticum]OQS32592.1 hypothetical protein B0T45_21560 [Chromobacterium haemolyticum]
MRTLIFVTAVLLFGCSRGVELEAEVDHRTMEEKIRDNCISEEPARKQAFMKAVASGGVEGALDGVRVCERYLVDKDFLAMIKEQSIKSLVKTIEDKAEKTERRIVAVELLEGYDKELFEKYSARLDAIKKEGVKAAEQALNEVRAQKRSEGVSIGMNQDDVLLSSWGAPKSKRRTVTEYGVNEQWVYSGYQYLYFENGRLVAVQN